MKREKNISKLFLDEKKKQENESKKRETMKEIELKTEKKLVLSLESGEMTNPIVEKDSSKVQHNMDILQSLLSDGAKEFKEKTGRNMTYSEMREMYG
jgi:hypothetical protein